jgi:RNA polymerase sigma-70 factor (ECF subfamily)
MMDVLVLPVSRTDAGAEARLRAAIDAHYDVVWRFLRRMGVREAAVEDAAQQVLIVFARRIQSIEVEAERSFLIGTALRVAADHRKQTARQREVSDEQALSGWAANEPHPDDEIDERRARQLLGGILARMPEDLRSVLVMCDLEELTMADAASSLAIAPGTVASRLRRARVLFQEIVHDVRTARAVALQAGGHE